MANATTLSTDDEQNLARRFRDGDVDAFRQLHTLHADRLRAFLCSRCRGKLDADDLCQDVWLRAWSRRDRFDDGHFRGWIFAIAHHRLTDEYRKKSPGTLPETFDPATVLTDGDDERLHALQECLRLLGGEFVEVIRAQLAGEEVSDIAARLGIQPATVYTRVSRGKTELGECVRKKLS